jgi:anti-sigma factor RsiW
MDCEDVRTYLLGDHRGQLAPELAREVRAHLERCAACAHEDAAEHALTDLLAQRLPRHPAPLALKHRLAGQWPSPATARGAAWSWWRRAVAPALAAVLVLAVAAPWLAGRLPGVGRGDGAERLVTETVNDHLRVLLSEHPLEVQSGGIHRVKPWFAGRLDFAPVVPFGGDADFPLKGGAVGWFVDRKAAVFVYQRRLHPISLFVVRADGLPWPARGGERIGSVEAYRKTERGFNVILWRAGDLGYALVSDVDPKELADLAAKLAG